jgi:hypothetical protein
MARLRLPSLSSSIYGRWNEDAAQTLTSGQAYAGLGEVEFVRGDNPGAHRDFQGAAAVT